MEINNGIRFAGIERDTKSKLEIRQGEIPDSILVGSKTKPKAYTLLYENDITLPNVLELISTIPPDQVDIKYQDHRTYPDSSSSRFSYSPTGDKKSRNPETRRATLLDEVDIMFDLIGKTAEERRAILDRIVQRNEERYFGDDGDKMHSRLPQ